MAGKQISQSDGQAALADLPAQLPTAVRYLLQQIEKNHRGGTIELRVPPFGAVQCMEGMNHRRGTPPNVVELSPEVFIALCSGDLAFDEARTKQGCHFSGERTSELASVFPTKN
jgi:hypothetical protein